MGRLLRGLAVVAVLGGLAVLAGSAVLQWRKPPETTPVTVDVIANPRERVRVEVLNAGGVAGMARAATEVLRNAGFDVVDYDNAGAFDRDSSLVLARMGRVDLASMVADALAIPSYQSQPDSTAYVDVTVLLGSTWDPSILIEREAGRAQDSVAAPPPETGWRGILSRIRDWADGLNQAGNQR